MTQLQQTKTNLINQLRGLCASCHEGRPHGACPVISIERQVLAIKGTPLIVNNKFYGILNPKF